MPWIVATSTWPPPPFSDLQGGRHDHGGSVELGTSSECQRHDFQNLFDLPPIADAAVESFRRDGYLGPFMIK